MSDFPEATDRVFIVGQTGSGKTYGADVLTRDLDRLLVVDPKHSESIADWDLEEWAGPTNSPTWRNLIRKGLDHHEEAYKMQRRILSGKPFRYRFAPPPDYNYEQFWRWIWDNLQGKNTTVYIDELYLTLENATGGKWLRALYTQGREKKIGTWGSSQRPRFVPKFAITESEWMFIFRLSNEEDRKYMKGYIGAKAMDDLYEHEFHAYHQSWRTPEKFTDITAEFEE